jgi:hypothetical protein
MPDPAMVLCIDGPLCGRLRAVKGIRFQAYDLPPVNAAWANDRTDLVTEALTYHVHDIHLLGFMTRIASLQIDQNKIDPYDVISSLYSEAGRQATYRVGQ